MTTKLTPTQRTILEHAADETDDVIVWFPDNLKGGAREKVIASLLVRGLIVTEEEIARGLVYRLTTTAYTALERDVLPDVVTPPAADNSATPAQETANTPANIDADQNEWVTTHTDPEVEAAVAAAEAQWAQEKDQAAKPRTRDNSKQATVIAMLKRPEGATVAQICASTGWQSHTVRGTFAGAFKKKLGLTITSEKHPGSERIYRLEEVAK